jgi:hypothetical protein
MKNSIRLVFTIIIIFTYFGCKSTENKKSISRLPERIEEISSITERKFHNEFIRGIFSQKENRAYYITSTEDFRNFYEIKENLKSINISLDILDIINRLLTNFRIPVSEKIIYQDLPKDGLGAYGYLIFTRRPRNEELSRYIHVCEAFFRNIELFPGYEIRSYHEIRLYTVTYWMLTTIPDLSPKQIEDSSYLCKNLVENYNYGEANKIASAISMVSSPGPILVAWEKPFRIIDPPYADALILDMSDFADEDFDRAMGIWKDRLARDPELWQKGFQFIKIREAFRNLIQKYGEKIVSLMTGTQ